MKNIDKRIKLLILALIVFVIAFGILFFVFVTNFLSPFSQSSNMQATTLKMPVLLQDQNPDPNIAEYVLDAQSGQTNFVGNRLTETLGYNGTYLGPVLRIRKGEKVNILVRNHLSFPTTIHWHGLLVDGEQDGGPHQGIQPGESWNPSFIVDQPAATLWYHPHFAGSTADQVYYGLAGLMYIEDDISDQLNLPKEYGINDIPLIVQDRSFNSDGSFDYQISMMGVVPGDTILINGSVNPLLNVNRGNIRFRILNASNSQTFEYKLSDGSKFQQIASDGGFLEAPVTRQSIVLSPGERAEVIIDFSQTTKSSVSLMIGSKSVMKINITGKESDTTEIPETLTAVEPITVGNNPVTRVFELQSMGINGTINDKTFDMDRIDEDVNLNETEIWIIRNTGGMMQTGGHPFHVHSTQFQVVSRDGKPPPPEEQGFKDTVFVNDGEEVVIWVRFSHPGIFMYHCHILEHEDNGMMGQFRVQ